VTASNSPILEEFSISDIMPDGDPLEFHKSMLDDVNIEARRKGWPGVLIANTSWCANTRILTLNCLRGSAPATLHLLKKVVAAQKLTDSQKVASA